MFRLSLVSTAVAGLGCLPSAVFGQSRPAPASGFQLAREIPLGSFGGVPYCVDLDQDGTHDVLWLQSAGMFSSRVYDRTSWKKRISEAERGLFCLTATNARGEILWQIGQTWRGDRPFLTHGNERTLDCADIDGDGTIEVVCAKRRIAHHQWQIR